MTAQQVYNTASAAGFTGSALIIAVAIAYAESRFNPSAIGDVSLQNAKWGPSVGLWQIRSLNNDFLNIDPVRNYNKLFDPQYNADAAFKISNGGKDFSPWSTYINGAYKGYLNLSDGLTQNKTWLTAAALILILIIIFKKYA